MNKLREWYLKTPEAFVNRTTALQRRALNFWLFILWLIPGTVIWIILKDALWFVGFMSLYAIWITHWTGFSAETPVETEDVERVEDILGGEN